MQPVRLLLAAAVLCTGNALAHGTLVDVAIVDRPQKRRLDVHWHEGRTYVAGTPGNEYAITLRNREPVDLLAVVSVDGVNVLTAQAAHPSQSGYVIGARGRLDIHGWRRNPSQTAAFYFTSVADSYAARTGRAEHVGKIEVALFRRKTALLLVSRAMAVARRAVEPALGTGHGRHETSHVIAVRFERASPEPAEVITLYYDSLPNLVARGVIREPLAVLPRPGGFAHDPRR